MPKQSVVRHVIGSCLALALLVGPGGVSAVRAQVPEPAPRAAPAPSPTPLATSGPCVQIPCATMGTDSVWCWCPDQELQLTPGLVETDWRFRYEIAVVNTLPVEVVLVDATGAVAAVVPAGATARLAIPGPGQYAYTLASPQVVSPPALTVVGLRG